MRNDDWKLECISDNLENVEAYSWWEQQEGTLYFYATPILGWAIERCRARDGESIYMTLPIFTEGTSEDIYYLRDKNTDRCWIPEGVSFKSETEMREYTAKDHFEKKVREEERKKDRRAKLVGK